MEDSGGGSVVGGGSLFLQDKDLHDLVEKKKREERRSYPEILQKLTLYLEAGLTVRSAFCRVAEDYEKERKRGGRCRSLRGNADSNPGDTYGSAGRGSI